MERSYEQAESPLLVDESLKMHFDPGTLAMSIQCAPIWIALCADWMMT